MSRGALIPGGHHFGPLERQPHAQDAAEDAFPPPPSLEQQVRAGLKRTHMMYLANYGQRPEVDEAR